MKIQFRGRRERPINIVYDLWQRSNYFAYATFASSIAIISMLFMMVFDYLFLGEGALPFIFGRMASLVLLAPCYLIAKKFKGTKIPKESTLFFPTILLMLPALIFTGLYYYYVVFLGDLKFDVYYVGLLLVAFYCTFALHRFWIAQYLYGIVSIATAGLLVPFVPGKADALLIVIASNLGCMTIFAYFRKDFVSGLLSRFDLLSTIVPARFAELIVASSDAINPDELFKPRGRFTVCLCADWRNFQTLTRKKTSHEISVMLERYYDLLIEALNQKIPSNNYFFNWTADELFIVFFNDEDKREDVMSDALKFARALADEVYEKIKREFKGEVIYDIGIASGIGLLGLQGPSKMKKTTIAGEVAGQAKRFEEEAKRNRSVRFPNASPLVVIDEELYQCVYTSQFFERESFETMQGSVKDIQGKACYLWCKDKGLSLGHLKRVS